MVKCKCQIIRCIKGIAKVIIIYEKSNGFNKWRRAGMIGLLGVNRTIRAGPDFAFRTREN